ncbi:MAG: hypothetical protein WBC02_07780 [Candidatus Aminicenantaceae bacterium]
MGKRSRKECSSSSQDVDVGSVQEFTAIAAQPVRSEGIYGDDQEIPGGSSLGNRSGQGGRVAVKNPGASTTEGCK